jgi:hypothetical protein
MRASVGSVEAERGQSVTEAECVRVQELVRLLEYGAEMRDILLTPRERLHLCHQLVQRVHGFPPSSLARS